MKRTGFYMAIINCKDCGNQYSDIQERCERCGCPTEYNILNNSANPQCGKIMYCGKCGNPTDDHNSFCVFCGSKIDGSGVSFNKKEQDGPKYGSSNTLKSFLDLKFDFICITRKLFLFLFISTILFSFNSTMLSSCISQIASNLYEGEVFFVTFFNLQNDNTYQFYNLFFYLFGIINVILWAIITYKTWKIKFEQKYYLVFFTLMTLMCINNILPFSRTVFGSAVLAFIELATYFGVFISINKIVRRKSFKILSIILLVFISLIVISIGFIRFDNSLNDVEMWNSVLSFKLLIGILLAIYYIVIYVSFENRVIHREDETINLFSNNIRH